MSKFNLTIEPAKYIDVNPKITRKMLRLVGFCTAKNKPTGKKSNPIPNYYVGNTYGYEARKVCEDWDLSYNIGTAVTYLLRSSYKHDSPYDCIQKAINHLNFELDKLNNREQ